MAIPGLKNIPSEYRDIYEHAYEILTRLRDRQAELTVLMEGEKDSIKRNKYSKERTNINRWLGDVTQAPETFTGIELSKYTNKQLGQRVHTVARSLMDRFNIDPTKPSAGGSTQHHIDSIMQMQGAYEGASIDTIFRINQSLKEEGIYLGTNAEGRNFYDVDITTHPDFHKLTPDERVDYSNTWAKITAMPTSTPEERVARIRASSEITQNIARRAANSPLYLGRAQAIQTAAESVQPDIVQQFGAPFDPTIVGEAKLQRASAYRKALVTYLGGGATLNKAALAKLTAIPVLGGGVTLIAAGQQAMAGDLSEAAFTVGTGVIGEVPVVGDVAAEFIEGTPVASGELTPAKADPQAYVKQALQEKAQRGKEFSEFVQLAKQRPSTTVNPKELERQRRAAAARQRGGKVKIGFNGAKFTLPEFGLSELLGFN